MDLSDLKTSKQAEFARKFADYLNDLAVNAEGHGDDYADDLETVLQCLQDGVLDELGQDDFFGTEGWEHYFGLDG